MLVARRDDVVDEARRTTRRVARTFAIACRMLPRSLRDDVYLLYLVFRTLDDAVDEGRPDAEERVAAVERWAAGAPPESRARGGQVQSRARARGGQVQSRARAPAESREAELLADLATRYPIPRDAVAQFCLGMRGDLEGRPIVSEEELDRYCYRVAGTVGVVMASVLGIRRPEAAEHAAALGMAMQRTNILRDIDEDLAYGRIYLARETLDRYGSLEPGAREQLVRDQIARADALYDQGIAGIPELRHGRRAIAAASAMYREILRQIERDGYGRVAGRAVVPRRRKVMLAARKVVLPS